MTLEVPTNCNTSGGYRVVRGPHGIAIYGSVPSGDFHALLNQWGEEGFKFLRTDIADVLDASAVIVRSDVDAAAWLAALGVRRDNPDWLKSGDCGTSSKTIYAAFTGNWHILRHGMDDAAPPSDADDFGRCHRLLKRYPEWRADLSKVVQAHSRFGPVVAIWDELEALFEAGKYDEVTKRISEVRAAAR